ncbi:MAG: flavodoxin family protein [Intestinimonas sp.]|jgi:multimeric flavodoxin WrbA|nr:flavodoxin family protein [Intestinimonas sp.]
MKKIIIVDASPRKGGNSDVMTEKLSAEIKGAEVEVFKLREKTVNPCQACDICKTKDTPQCVQKDDMGGLIPKLDRCDAIVLVAPIYFNQINGPAKTFIDRTYCFFNLGKEGASIATKKGKKAAVICTCGGGPVDAYTKVAEATAGDFGIIGVTESKVYVCGDGNEPGSCKDHPEYMQAACDIAAWLSK